MKYSFVKEYFCKKKICLQVTHKINLCILYINYKCTFQVWNLYRKYRETKKKLLIKKVSNINSEMVRHTTYTAFTKKINDILWDCNFKLTTRNFSTKNFAWLSACLSPHWSLWKVITWSCHAILCPKRNHFMSQHADTAPRQINRVLPLKSIKFQGP